MKKLTFLALFGLLIAGPLSAQAITDHGKIDHGPHLWPIQNPCTPGDIIALEYYAKGHWSWTENSQGTHYTTTIQYTGEGVGSETGLVFTLQYPAQHRDFENFDGQALFRHKDEIMLVGKGEEGVEQKIEMTFWFQVEHILPDGTPHTDVGFGTPFICKMNKMN